MRTFFILYFFIHYLSLVIFYFLLSKSIKISHLNLWARTHFKYTYLKMLLIHIDLLKGKCVGLSFGFILSSACIYYYFSTNVSLYFITKIHRFRGIGTRAMILLLHLLLLTTKNGFMDVIYIATLIT